MRSMIRNIAASMGVTDKVLSEFSIFKQRVLGLRHARQNLATGIADYQPTFWYYLILSK